MMLHRHFEGEVSKNITKLSDVTPTAKEEFKPEPPEAPVEAPKRRSFPYHDYPTDEDGNPVIEARYLDLQYRMALDLYNKQGAEGQISHSENGVLRSYESSWISAQLLEEVTPFVGTVS